MRLTISPRASLRANVISILMLGTTLFGSALPTAAAADNETEGRASYSSWGIGVGVSSHQKPYIDIDRDNKVLPIVTYENAYIRLAGPELAFKLPEFKLTEASQINFELVGKYDFTDYEQSDTPILNGMEDRDGGFWVGFRSEWESSYAVISAEFVTEVSGDSDGNAIHLGIEKTLRFGEKFLLTPRAMVSWLDKDYVDYYYGVRSAEVTAERPLYRGEAGMNVEVGIRGGYMIQKNHRIFLDASVTSLASEIKDSPLVDSSSDNRIVFGYIYSF